MKTFASGTALLLALASFECNAQTSTNPRWYVTGELGASTISDAQARFAPAAGPAGSGRLRLGGGLSTGGSVGWYWGPDWRIEADYIYRTNTLRSTTVPGLDATQTDADYASVLITLNLLKDFEGWTTAVARFRPYVGVGLGIAQEVDTDLQINGQAREFSGSRAAWQVSAGVNWQYRSPWFAGVGLRYVDAGTLRLKGSTPGSGEIKADYKGLGVHMRVGYRF